MRTTRRRPETEIAKKAFTAAQPHAETFSAEHVFDYSNETIIQEFEHWVIIENRFPYDLVLAVNHMLAPKRIFGYLAEATAAELAEYYDILKQLEADGYYESMMENFTRGRSVHRHVHIHLMVWKHEKDIVGQTIDWDAYPELT